LPQALRQLDHALELSLLVVLADQVAHHVGAEAALRADGEALAGDMAARLVDAALERFERLKLGQLGRPVLDRFGVRTSILAERFDAGEDIEVLAREYSAPPEAIQNAIRYERRAA
jgi:uncharacterized protein (DUF433 family)